MATRTRNQRRQRAQPAGYERIARLRAEIARLRDLIRELRDRPLAAARKRRTPTSAAVPALPPRDADGNYPATETLRAVLAQQIVRRRTTAGWTQAELARRAGVRQETVSRLESGKHAPNVATVDKLDRALKEADV